MKAYYYGFLLTFQFFSIIPINVEVPMTDEHIERSIRLFPLLGFIFGWVYALVAYVLQTHTPLSNLLIAFIIWFLTIALSGGLHIDGWMDTADAYFSYQDKEKRLEIMGDPRIGAFGVLGAIVLLAAKFILIYEVLINSRSLTFMLIPSIPMLSRMLMGLMLTRVPNAKSTGLGYLFQKAQTTSTLSFYVLYVLFALPFIFIDWRAFSILLILIGTMFGAFLFIKKKVVKWFGGITGDVIGASTEGVEVLLWFVLLLLHYFGMV